MKKLLSIILLGAMVVSICSCGGSSTDKENADKKTTEAETVTEAVVESITEQAPEATTEKQRDFPEGDYQDIGSGTFYISNASGTTENGDEIIVYPDKDSIPMAYVDIELWDMDGKVLTYIYVDGIFYDKQQVGEGYQASIDLMEESQVTEGDHIIEVVQYPDNNTEKEMSFYRSAKYTVKWE